MSQHKFFFCLIFSYVNNKIRRWHTQRWQRCKTNKRVCCALFQLQERHSFFVCLLLFSRDTSNAIFAEEIPSPRAHSSQTVICESHCHSFIDCNIIANKQKKQVKCCPFTCGGWYSVDNVCRKRERESDKNDTRIFRTVFISFSRRLAVVANQEIRKRWTTPNCLQQ